VAEDQDPTDASTKAIKDRNQRVRAEAAAKRKSRREQGDQRRANVQRNLDASEIVDDAFARGTHAATGFLKRHLNIIQWVVVAGALGGLSWQFYAAHKHKSEAKATDTLSAGLIAEFARVGEEEAEVQTDPGTGLGDPRPHFADDGARLKAAQDAYKAASGSENIRTLAQLGLAGALFDAEKYKDALAAYQSVRTSALAKTDGDVLGRSIEGIGLTQEALGEKDAARKAFHELGNSADVVFAGLGLYHEARLAFAAGQNDPAKELLKKALDKVKSESADAPVGFVNQMARDLLGRIDPSAVPPLPTKNQLTPEQIQALTKQAGEGEGQDGAPGLSKEKLDELLRALKQQQPAPAPSGAPAGKP
jgi:hypothetical protein